MSRPKRGLYRTFSPKQKIGLVLGPLLFLIVEFGLTIPELNAAARSVLAATAWIATWWITEALPIEVTALLPIVLFPLTGGMEIRSTTAPYGHPLIFLFIGGFIIAVAIEHWDLHKRIAMNIIRTVGTDSSRIVLGFMLATALLSMWISNTATSLMMMPIGVAVIHQLRDFIREGAATPQQERAFGKALMLSIAYSASTGGMATLIGTPTNVIFSGVVKQLYNYEISFAAWLLFGLPVAVLLLLISWWYLVRVAFGIHRQKIPGARAEIDRQLAALGPMSYEEKAVLSVFSAVAFFWITRGFVLDRLIPGIDDTIIAIGGAVVLFLIPAKNAPGRRILDWQTAVKLPWGIVILFGGGLALAAGFKDSGLAEWIGKQLSLLEGIAFLFILAFVIGAVNFLTEITSNTATAAMILPILAGMAVAIDVHPFGLMTGATLAASCAFMLPVATPPNAVVFGSGYLEMEDMIRAGIWMNLASILVLTLLVYFLLPLLWGIDLQTFPAEFRP